MLTQHDIDFMSKTTSEIVTIWNSSLTMITQLPDSEQNYNPILKEISGRIKYKKKQIPAERKYIVNNYDHNIEVNRGGDKDTGTITYSIPAYIDGEKFEPTVDQMICIGNDIYRIRSIRERIGENIIILYKHTGVNINNIDIIEDVIPSDNTN